MKAKKETGGGADTCYRGNSEEESIKFLVEEEPRVKTLLILTTTPLDKIPLGWSIDD